MFGLRQVMDLAQRKDINSLSIVEVASTRLVSNTI